MTTRETEGWKLEDVSERVRLAVNIMSTMGYVPRSMAKHYQNKLENSNRIVRVTFYKQLKAQCPKALGYFFIFG